MVDAYVFPKPPETSLRYQLIDNEMLWYVVSTRNKQAVKIYTYLVNKFLWKRQTQEYRLVNILLKRDELKTIN